MWFPPFGFCPALEPKGGKPRALFAAKKKNDAAVGKDSDSFAGTSLPAAHSPANGLAQVEKTITGDQQKALACVVAATELGSHIVAMESQSPAGFWKCWFASCENDPVVGERCLAS